RLGAGGEHDVAADHGEIPDQDAQALAGVLDRQLLDRGGAGIGHAVRLMDRAATLRHDGRTSPGPAGGATRRPPAARARAASAGAPEESTTWPRPTARSRIRMRRRSRASSIDSCWTGAVRGSAMRSD